MEDILCLVPHPQSPKTGEQEHCITRTQRRTKDKGGG